MMQKQRALVAGDYVRTLQEIEIGPTYFILWFGGGGTCRGRVSGREDKAAIERTLVVADLVLVDKEGRPI